VSLEQVEGLLGPGRGDIIREAKADYRSAFLADLDRPGPMGVRVPDVLVWDGASKEELQAHVDHEHARIEAEQKAEAEAADQSANTLAAELAPNVGATALS
jgi:hypothetical protein